MRRMLRELVRYDMNTRSDACISATTSQDAIVEYVVGALWSLVVWWLESSSPHTAQDMNDLFRRLSLNGLTADLV
jgi:hypothetical protein